MHIRDTRHPVPDAEELLSHLGLERRRSPTERTLVSLGLFAGGLVAGLGAAWLLERRPEERRARSGPAREHATHEHPG